MLPSLHVKRHLEKFYRPPFPQIPSPRRGSRCSYETIRGPQLKAWQAERLGGSRKAVKMESEKRVRDTPLVMVPLTPPRSTIKLLETGRKRFLDQGEASLRQSTNTGGIPSGFLPELSES